MKATTQRPDLSRARLAEGQTNGWDPPRWWATIQLAALSFHIPLSVLSGTQRALASVAGAVGVGVATSASFLLLYWVLRRVLRSGWRSLALTSASVLLFWHGSGLSLFVGDLAWLVNVIIAVLILTAAFRHADRRLFKLVSFVASATLGATLLLLIVLDSLSTPAPVVSVQNPLPDVTLTSTPDIYLIVLDGYARADVMERLYNFDNSAFFMELESNEFDVAELSSSNYTITHLSLPSLLNMSYMNEPLDYMHNSDLEELARITSGNNAFVRILKNNGYAYVHGDSDHWFNTCGPLVDSCLEGPLLDVTSHALLLPTPVGGLIYPTSGDPTTALNRLRIRQMASWSSERPQVASPTFTFLHLILPHPPLFLDSNCDVRIDEDLRQRVMNDGTTPREVLERRKDAWVEQVECANKTILDFLPNIEDDDIVVLTSDHGPDSTFVIETTQRGDLTPERLEERLPNLTAVKLPLDCASFLPPDVHLVNVLRTVLDCLTDDRIALLDDRYYAATFGGSIIELDYVNSAGN